MYCEFYGLSKKPFELIPDPNTLFMSEAHREAISILRYGVISRKGFLLLTGEVGTGKTTLLQVLIDSLNTKVHSCFIANPTLSMDDFYYYLSSAYGLREYNGNKAKFMLEFSSYLAACGKENEQVLLIIDEAHVLPVELLEEIRLLSNQGYREYGVLSIFLVGQPELNDRLNQPRLLPLRQRIGIRFHLQPFSQEETAEFIKFRLRSANCPYPDLFTQEAFAMIHAASKGTARLINVLCDHCLLSGFAENRHVIEEQTVRECVTELNIPGDWTTFTAPDSGAARRFIPSMPRPMGMVLTILFCIIMALIVISWVGGQSAGTGSVLDWFQKIIQHGR